MTDSELDLDWQTAINETYDGAVSQLLDNLPQIIGVIGILLVGLIVATLLRFVARRVILTLEGTLQRSARKRGLARPTRKSSNKVIGNIVFWTVLLFFMAGSADLLGWDLFSDLLGALIEYLPSLFLGLLIILVGFVLGSLLHSLVLTTATTAGIVRPELAARSVQIAVVMTSLIIGIEHLGIDITFFTTTFIVFSAVLLFGVALAFGMGAREYVANLIGAQVSRRHFQAGQWIRLGDIEGHLLEITQTALVLDTEGGRLVIPASLMQQGVGKILTAADDDGGGGSSLLGNLFRKKEDPDGSA